ncbi:MAG: YceI family protein [Acidimicrobiia bacterium]|nr:YceI family protein [Acidimicrobiia bacterium]
MTNRTKYLAAAGAAGLVIVVFAVWFLIFRDTAPPAASLEEAVGSVTSTTSAESSSGGSLDGTWTIDTTVGGGVLDDGSYVGYRVQEELATIGAKIAVGRTPVLSGSFEFTGTMLSSATIEADLRQLTSDDSRRDGAIRRQALESDTFPDGSFVLTAPVDLGTVPGAGESFTVQAAGDLTIHGVTRSVTVPINGQLVGDTVVVVGSIEITFADYDIEKPTAGIVLSVDDVGEMEFQLFLRRS